MCVLTLAATILRRCQLPMLLQADAFGPQMVDASKRVHSCFSASIRCWQRACKLYPTLAQNTHALHALLAASVASMAAWQVLSLPLGTETSTMTQQGIDLSCLLPGRQSVSLSLWYTGKGGSYWGPWYYKLFIPNLWNTHPCCAQHPLANDRKACDRLLRDTAKLLTTQDSEADGLLLEAVSRPEE